MNSNMATMNRIHEFVAKWCEKFNDPNINDIELCEHYLADDCKELGFEMDSGHAFPRSMEMLFTITRS